MGELHAALLQLIAPLGLTMAVSGVVSGPKAASPNPFHFTNWPPALVAEYLAEDFLTTDPLPRWARNSGLALSWSDLIGRLSPRDPGRRAIETAARYGLTEGMAVPTRASDNSLGLVTFGGGSVVLTPARRVCLAMIARAAFEAADRIEHGDGAGRPAAILSEREVECIRLLVRGHSDRRIARLLGISEPTVRFHLGNAREKMDAASRTHLAALAISQGFVSL